MQTTIKMESVIETSIANISLIELSKDELLDEYKSLLKKHEGMLQDVEQKNQQIYDYKRQITHLTTLEHEYLQEIETLQTQDANFSKKTAELVENYEEQIKTVKEMLQQLEDESNEKSKRIEELENDLKTAIQYKPEVDNSAELTKMIDENFTLKDELSQLVSLIEESEFKYNELNLSKTNAEEQLQQLREEYSNMQMNYNAKRDEVVEKNTLIENLQDELVVMKSELDQFKAKPQDQDTRGNSLFAEVNDRRVQLTKEMKFMQTQFREMKAEREKMLREVAYLQKENFNLQEKYKADVIEKADCLQIIEDAYKHRVKTLESVVESYKNDYNNKPFILSGSNLLERELKFVESVLKQRSTEINQLRESLNKYTTNDVITMYQLRDCKAEIRKWKSQATDYKQKIDELKLAIEMKKTDEKPIEVVKKQITPAEQLANLKKAVANHKKKCALEKEEAIIDPIENKLEPPKNEFIENKENDFSVTQKEEKVTRKVTFATDTKESSNHITTRKGGKVLTCKTLYVTSEPKQ